MYNHAPPGYECSCARSLLATLVTTWSSPKTNTPRDCLSKGVGDWSRPRLGGAQVALENLYDSKTLRTRHSPAHAQSRDRAQEGARVRWT